MKTNCWLILGTMLATAAVAQVNTNLPAIPPPATAAPAAEPAPVPVAAPADTATNAPAKKIVKSKKKTTKKKKVAKDAVKPASEAPSAPVILVSGPATVEGENVNLRGQAGLKGEVVGHVKKGDTVTVISEINIEKPKAGEPAQWAKIALPSDTKVWIDSKYVDKSNNTVAAKKLNLRGGPGENYSVLGVIEKGAAITSVETKGDWIQIQPPASAFAFVAASLLKQEAGAVPPAGNQPPVASIENVPPPPQPAPPTQATVTEAPPIAPPAATPPPVTAPVPPPTPEIANTTPPPAPGVMNPQPTLAPDVDTNLPPPPPRVVTHEGTVRHSVSPVAPTYFELFDPENDKAIDYLFTSSTNLNLARYDSLHITVTGEEALDPRWKDTPVLTIEKIYVLSQPPKPKPMHPHK